MGDVTIDSFRGALCPIFTNMWEVKFESPVVAPPASLRFQVRISNLPGFSTEETEIFWMRHKIKVAGKGSYPGTLAMTFEEMVGANNSAYKWLYDWRQMYHNHLDGTGVCQKTYKCDKVIIAPLTTENAEAFAIELRGVYPTEVSDVPLDYSSTDPMRIEVTFSYDYWVHKASSTSPVVNNKTVDGVFNDVSSVAKKAKDALEVVRKINIPKFPFLS